ncbi:hypothetical protein [Actinomadura madurae]|uniref:hypothetical protein n=1 Tax=Actinomadura madurae TaxID=1993 RepID=UPI0020D249D4|nr:hypothetical protein [Actinomadura madurae]MCP9953405.1 hypothetical protein [Actinomadura madurae]MCP9970168.1 hypothetical protein [Actinomadura madurae]MCP9982632.1 hypothetical protein [Actinomadura madurae]
MVAAHIPQAPPATREISTAGTATDSVVPPATISRARTLRPSASLPSTYSQPSPTWKGGVLVASRFCRVSRSPIRRRPSVAASTTARRTAAAAVAAGSRSSSRHQRVPVRGGRSPGFATPPDPVSSMVAVIGAPFVTP